MFMEQLGENHGTVSIVIHEVLGHEVLGCTKLERVPCTDISQG